MSDAIENIDVDGDEYVDTPRALRDAYKKLQSQVKDLRSERDTLKGQVTTSALAEVLKVFKNPERVKRDLLADKVDPLDNEAVTKWLGSNGDDYAKGQAAPPSTDPGNDPDEAAAHAALNAGAELRTPADMSKVQAFESEITPQMTGADIIALAKKHGV